MKLKRPLFFLALCLIALVVLVEVGSGFAVSTGSRAADEALEGSGATPPGFGIPFMALLDSLILFTTLIMGGALIFPERIYGRLQGVGTLIVSFFAFFGAIVLIFVALILLLLMVGLLLAPIFGTVAYFVLYADFDRGGAAIILSLLMLLKLGFGACLVLAHPRFLQNKGLVLIILTTLLANFILSFLHGFVPGFLVSVTDTLGAIVMALLAAIWALIYLIGSIISVVKALKFRRAEA